MTEQTKENEHPVNQKARELLVQAKQVPDSNVLYCLQLGFWSIQEGLIRPVYEDLTTFLEELLYQESPDKVISFLLEDGENSLEQEMSLAKNPKDGAFHRHFFT